jgi:serine/arginine repetitive matrix protein 2
MPRSRAPINNTNSDAYDDDNKRRDDRRSSYAESSSSTLRDDKDRKKAKDKAKDKGKDKKLEKRRSTRSVRSGSLSQTVAGHRGEIVDSPKSVQRSFSGQIGSDGFSQFPGQAGAPMMSGALPVGSHYPPPHPEDMSSHVQSQFPGQDPVQYTSSALPGGHPFGAAAEFYHDQGQSVHQQPGVRPQPPAVIIGQDTPHLMSASAQPNPVADTGSGAAADFYGPSTNTSSSKPPRPSSSSMPGAFIDDAPMPQKPPRPASSSRPGKSSTFGPAATVAGGAALGYAMGHSSSNHEHSTSYSSSNVRPSSSYPSYTNNPTPAAPASTYNLYGPGSNSSNTAANDSSYLPPYAAADTYGVEGAPPPKPPRPGKSEKQSSGSIAGLYAAGAAGLAAYGLNQHNSHSHTHSNIHSHSHSTSHHHSSTHGPNGHQHNGLTPSPYITGGMAHQHQHTGPVSKFVDWWKDYEDVQKMEEYTEYIGVCKGCFDPRSSVLDAPRKHHYYKRRSNEFMRPSGGIEKQSRYSLKEKKSHNSFSSGDERRKTKSSAAGWVAAGLGGIGLAKAGKAVFSAGRDDFDDTYSIKSGRSGVSRHSRSRSQDRKSWSYGSSGIRHRSNSADRISVMSVGVTSDKKDRKDHKVVRRKSRSRHSRSSSSSSSNSGRGKTGLLGTAIGAGLAGVALGAATKKKQHSRSRSPKRVQVVHPRRDSSDDERRRRRSHQLRHKASRSSTSGASVIEIGGQTHESQSGFLGGFFSAPPPKEKRVKTTNSLKKKKKGFFNFGNASASSSDSEMAFGTGYVKRTRRRSSPKRRNSNERLKASLIGLGATAAAITAAKAGKGKRHNEVVAVKENRLGRKASQTSRPGSRFGDDEWEDLPDDGTSDTSSDGGLVYGDYALKKTKSNDSIGSNDSGTNKWNWRWGFGKKKRRSSNNLYDNIASTSLIGPAAAGAAGALTGAAVGAAHGHHDSESSSAQTLQSVYPVAPHDPNASFDARRTSSIVTNQPLVTSGPGPIPIQHPQPVQQVPGAIYSTQAPSQSGYTAPAGPSAFPQAPYPPPYPTQSQVQNIIIQSPQHPAFRRANSSPIQSSSWKRDAAIAGLAATVGAAAVSALKHPDRPPSRPPSASSNVRFNLTQEQAEKELRERRKQQERLDEEADRRREEEDRIRREQQLQEEARREALALREEEERLRREQQLREDEARRIEEDRRQTLLRLEETARQEEERRRDEDERRRLELQRQQDEARKFMDIERLARLENERRREQQEVQARLAREAEDRERHQRMSQKEHQRQLAIEAAEAERKRRERRESQQQEAERIDAARREAEIQEDMERRRREREAQDYTDRYENDRARKLEQQPTGDSIASTATVVQRKEQELQDREREAFKSDKKSSVAGAVAAGAAAAIATAAISSYKDKEKEREREKKLDRKRDSSSKKSSKSESSSSKSSKNESSSKSSKGESSSSKSSKKRESASVKTIEPSKIKQDIFDDDIFNPDMFKKDNSRQEAREILQDWETRYSAPQVSQAEFFAPKELLENNNLPKVHAVDPNEGAPDLPVYQSYEDYPVSQPKVPPYPPSYAFTATRDGRSSRQQPPPPVPSLNLILPTPPGSRTPSVRSASAPPSPAMEPIRETRREPRDDDANRARSRVSWGENQFHHFDVPTPESYREQFVSDGDLKSREAPVVREATKPEQNTSTYTPYRPEMSTVSESKETAPSTQYIRDEKDSSWDSVVDTASKKSKKKEKKSAAAAAAAALTTAAVLSRNEEDERDYRRDHATASNSSNPTASNLSNATASNSSNWTASTVSNATAAGFSNPTASNISNATASNSSNWTASTVSNATAAGFSNPTASSLSNPFSDANKAPSTIAPSIISAAPSSTITPSIISAAPSTSSVQTAYWQPESERDAWRAPQQTTVGPGFVEGEIPTPPATMHMPGGWDDIPDSEVPAEEPPASSTKKDAKGKNKIDDTDEIVAMRNVSRRGEPMPAIKEKEAEPEAKLSKKEKKDKKKKSKSSKRASVDTWEISDVSPPTSPIMDRDPRDIEPSRPAETSRSTERSRSMEPSRPVESSHLGEPFQESSSSSKKTSQQEESSGSKFSTAAMAGGFAALMGMTKNQDQDRMASDLERARKNLESTEQHRSRDSPVSPPNGARALEEHEKNVTIPSYAFEGVDELADKTPRPKAQKRHSSGGGKWSPSISSPLRTETKYEDYMGARTISDPSRYQTMVEAPKVPTAAPFTTTSDPITARNVTDSGYYAPDDVPHRASNEKESNGFYPADFDEKARNRNARDERDQYIDDRYDDDFDDKPRRYDDDDVASIASLSYKYDDPDREERRRRRREARSETREKSHDRGYDLEEGGERRRRHRRHEADDGADDWDTKSAVSDTRSEVPGERRRKHKRRESERDPSPEAKTRSRSTAASELGDYDDDRKSSRRRSKRDDDMVSVVSSIPDLDEDRSSRREKEKRPSGFLGLFSSKSRENLAEASSKSKSRDDDDEERKHRRRKHRSERGSTYGGSDDDDMRSTISSSSRREKRSSRSRGERGDGDRTDAYDDKVHRSSHVR